MKSNVPSGLKTVGEFWPYYVREHLNPISRGLHFIASLSSLILFIVGLITLNVLDFVAAPIISYTLAWIGHFIFEKNRPATFKYPVMSLVCDYRMFFFMLQGRMSQEIEKAKQPNLHFEKSY